MIPFLLPTAVAAAFLTGCSKSADSPENKYQIPLVGDFAKLMDLLLDREAKPPKPLQIGDKVPELPQNSYYLGEYAVSDQNNDQRLNDGDLLFKKNGAELSSYTLVDPNSQEIQAYLKSIGHDPGRSALHLRQVQSYLQVHQSPARPFEANSWISTIPGAIRRYEKAKEYAGANGLEFEGSAYLTYIQRGLEREYSDWRCPALGSLNDYLECPHLVDQRLEKCRFLAEGLNAYLGVDRSSEIRAMEKQAAKLNDQLKTQAVAGRCVSSDW